MNNYIVKIKDEKYGDSILVVAIPKDVSEKEVFNTFDLAKRFAKFELSEEIYGDVQSEQFEKLCTIDEMWEVNRFVQYLKLFKQWQVTDCTLVDYEF